GRGGPRRMRKLVAWSRSEARGAYSSTLAGLWSFPMIFRSFCCVALLALAVAPASAQEKTFGIFAADSIADDGTATGSKLVAKDDTPTLTGNAMITNGRLLAVVRKWGVDLYSLGSGKPVRRATLVPKPVEKIEKVTVAENGRSTLAIDVATKFGTTQFRLKKGEHFVETRAISGTTTLSVKCASRFAVLPDFFADDILFDARKVP